MLSLLLQADDKVVNFILQFTLRDLDRAGLLSEMQSDAAKGEALRVCYVPAHLEFNSGA